MGLASLWASITGPRVKEISPSSSDFWPERGRPTTSSAARAARRDSIDDQQTPDKRKTRRLRLARSFSRPRFAQRASSRASERLPYPDPKLDKDLPAVPPLPAHLRNDSTTQDESQPEDIGRPGTAISTEGLQALSIFELAAAPSPASEKRNPFEKAPVLRERSKSTGPEYRPLLSKGSQWFRLVNGNKGHSLPPPPPPTCPLPPVPKRKPILEGSMSEQPRGTSVESQVASVHDLDSRSNLSSSSSTTTKTTLDDESLLDSFPLPRLVHEPDETPDSSVADSEAGSVMQSTPPAGERERLSFRYKKVPARISVGQPYGHKHKDSAIGTPRSPHTPTGFKRWTRQDSSFDEDDVHVPAEFDLEQWGSQLFGGVASNDPVNERTLSAFELGALK